MSGEISIVWLFWNINRNIDILGNIGKNDWNNGNMDQSFGILCNLGRKK